ncbi:ribosomal protein S18 [Acidimicrobium ferrooxidans DSM 10331]|uniref:Small ribosomal subunit protein bS18 n=1 Tax=Acidimicrobium ferrooxidans (strain DSM 10331 / JCM 15462 / NBRC 103882 / ICP) TaxID=525909 RepID=C7M1G9_ACIFD|nr:ribosomal protein S18 [Acidimicrobium ferrooxidans DSM 10331]
MPKTATKRKRRGREAPETKRIKKKPCVFCQQHVDWVDYKDVDLLRRFTSERAKIRARRVTGNCAQHQADVANAIKVARELALLPYVIRPVSDRSRRNQGDQPVGDRELRSRNRAQATDRTSADEEETPAAEEEQA